MTITAYDFEAGVNGVDLTTGGGITAVSSASKPTYSTAAAFTSSDMGVESVGQEWAEWAAPAADFSLGVYVKVTTNPGSGSQRFINFRTAAATLGGSIRFHSTGNIAITNSANSVVGASATTTWTTSDQFRFDIQVDDSGADVIVSLRIFKNANITGTTPDEVVTRTLTGVSDVASFRVGGNDSGSFTILWDNLQVSDVLEWVGPYIPAVVPLDTPVVTVTDETNPTTSGGSDGTITVTWPAVDDADHYVAEIATGHDQTSGFTLDDATATSPHIFTGLAAGNYTVSITAVPA